MVLSCISAEKVVLRYLSLGQDRIRFLSDLDSVQGFFGSPHLIEVRDVYRLTVDNSTETITWDWFPAIDDRIWKIKGFWTDAQIPSNTNNFTLHFHKAYGNFSLVIEEDQIVQWELKNHSYTN